jgi:hypothetical protein
MADPDNKSESDPGHLAGLPSPATRVSAIPTVIPRLLCAVAASVRRPRKAS